MNMIKGFIVLFGLLSHMAYGAQALVSASAKSHLSAQIAVNGSTWVIVGINNNAGKSPGLLSSALQASKTGFLRSSSVLHAQINQSLSVVDELDHLPYAVMEVKSAGLQTLLSHPQVSSIEPDRRLTAHLKTAVTKVVGVSNPWGKSTFNGQGSWVAVLDSGVNTSHPMFQGKSIVQACFTTDRSCPNGANTQYGGNAADPLGKSDHGTHVAGIAVGRYVPSKGLGGVAHKAGLIAIQVFDRDDAAYTSSLLRALNYVYSQAASKRVAAINLSLGGGLFEGSCPNISPSMVTSLNLLRYVRKVATIVSAGNDSSNLAISFPACIYSAIAVASATKQFRMSNFSNRNKLISLIAPGSSIQSASYGAGYRVYSGTSMAAPVIAGAFAVMRKENPSASVSAIEAALQSASRTVYSYPGSITDSSTHFWPLMNKARTNIGGTKKANTAVGFNTISSIDRFNKVSTVPWYADTSNSQGVNGVAYTDGHSGKTAMMIYPQTILTGRVSARMRSTWSGYGILINLGGSIYDDDDEIHDGYKLRINNTKYWVEKYEHGQKTTLVPPTNNPSIVNHSAPGWNTLMATTGGKAIKFYINGNLVAEDSSYRLTYGAPGIFADRSQNSRTYVDWFVTKSNATSAGYQ